MEEGWRKIALCFDAFLGMLHQDVESAEAADLREALESDDLDTLRRYVESRPTGGLEDEPDEATGHSLVQRAADAGAAKIVAYLIDREAKEMAGLGVVNVRRHARVVELLLTRGRSRPTEYDWRGAAAFGGPDVLRLYSVSYRRGPR